MKFAISIWEGRVSPVMDTAGQLLITEVRARQVVTREVKSIPESGLFERVRFILGQNIDVLICGAISQAFERMLLAGGVTVVPWYRGQIEDIIEAQLNGKLGNNSFFMPGCRRPGRHRKKGHRRVNHGHFGWRRNQREDQ